jgi:ParB family chromosome partitioning protein
VADRRLGRGLEALLSAQEDGAPAPVVETAQRPLNAAGVIQLPPEDIRPNPFQPRHDFPPEALQSLADSIQQHGVLQPIIVRQRETGYELVAGERRWRAAQHLGLASIPALVREATEQEMLLVALIENVQREDLNPIDRAKAYRDLCDRFGLKQEEAAAQLGIDRATLANFIRLLDLPEDVQALVDSGALTMGHARAILGVHGDERRRALAERVAKEGLSVRRVEELAAERSKSRKPAKRHVDPNVRSFEEQLMERLGTRVTIALGRRKDTGKIIVEFYSNDDFERIVEVITGENVPRGTSQSK